MKNLSNRTAAIMIIMLMGASCLVFYYVLIWRDTSINPVEAEIGWIIKGAEENSRNHSVPILLYHNIDGAGLYSLDYDALQTQFQADGPAPGMPGGRGTGLNHQLARHFISLLGGPGPPSRPAFPIGTI